MPGHRKGNYRIGGTGVLAVLVFISAGAVLAAGQVAVTTYHYDNNRTGWNKHETSLTPANIAQEVKYLGSEGRTPFERPYGLAWLLQLAAELNEWDDPDARQWSATLRPLAQAATIVPRKVRSARKM